MIAIFLKVPPVLPAAVFYNPESDSPFDCFKDLKYINMILKIVKDEMKKQWGKVLILDKKPVKGWDIRDVLNILSCLFFSFHVIQIPCLENRE